MPKLTMVAILLAGGAVASLSGQLPSIPDGTVWVTERTPGASTVAAIDAGTGTSSGWVSVGEAPIGITAPNGTGKVYSSDEGSDGMTVIDRDSLTVLGHIPMGA